MTWCHTRNTHGEGRSNLCELPEPDRGLAKFLCAGVLGGGGYWSQPDPGDLEPSALVSAPRNAPNFSNGAPKCAPVGPRIQANLRERLRTPKPVSHR